MNFEKDWRGIVPMLWWILLWPVLPFAVAWRAAQICFTNYDVDMHAGVLEYKHGIVNHTQDNIDLYRIKNVSANENVLTGGKITITNQDGSTIVLPYIKNANKLSVQIRNLANKKRQEISTLELM